MLQNLEIIEQGKIKRLSLRFNKVNIFIGHDGAGKSLILDMIRKKLGHNVSYLDTSEPKLQMAQAFHKIFKELSEFLKAEYIEFFEKETKSRNYGKDAETGEDIIYTTEPEEDDYPYSVDIANARTIIQSIGAEDYIPDKTQNYKVQFMNGPYLLPWNELTVGQMQTVRILYAILFADESNILLNRAESACFPAIFQQMAHNLLVSRKQSFIITDTILLYRFLNPELHEELSKIKNRNTWEDINLFICYISGENKEYRIGSRTSVKMLTGAELQEYAKNEDLFDFVSKYYK